MQYNKCGENIGENSLWKGIKVIQERGRGGHGPLLAILIGYS